MAADTFGADDRTVAEGADVHGKRATVDGHTLLRDEGQGAASQGDGRLMTEVLPRSEARCVLMSADATLRRLALVRIHAIKVSRGGYGADPAERDLEIGAMQATAADAGATRLPQAEVAAERGGKRSWSAHRSTVAPVTPPRRSYAHVESSGQVAVRLLMGIRRPSRSQFVPL